MGVTVQLMVDAEVSGVMFTCNPVSGDPSMVAIDASWGLGIAVVGGEVTPDDYLVSKVTGEVVRRTVSDKQSSTCPTPPGAAPCGSRYRRPSAGRACLDEEQLAALVELARRVERHFGAHQDVEWAIARRRLPALLVLQSRPVTAAPRRRRSSRASAIVARDEHLRRRPRGGGRR